MKRWILCGLAAVTLLASFSVLAFAQGEPPPVPPAELGVLERMLAFLNGLLAAGEVASVGFIVGLIARFIPQIKNDWVPRIVTLGNILLVASQVIGRFVEAVTGVTWSGYHNAIVYAGVWGGLKTFFIVAGTTFSGVVLAAFDRWAWEKLGKHAVLPGSPSVKGGEGF